MRPPSQANRLVRAFGCASANAAAAVAAGAMLEGGDVSEEQTYGWVAEPADALVVMLRGESGRLAASLWLVSAVELAISTAAAGMDAESTGGTGDTRALCPPHPRILCATPAPTAWF
jgi:hypothetical protein